MRIDLEPRPQRSRIAELAAPVAAFAVALLIGGIVVALLGKSPWLAFYVYFIEPLTQDWARQEIAVKAAPLILIALGLAFCFRANVWNIGAEGQFIAGGALGGWIAILTHGGAGQSLLGSWWILPAMLIAGVIGGLLYALIPAILRVSLGVSEILTSLMLVYVAQLTLDWLARGPWRNPRGFNFPDSVNFDDAARLPMILAEGRMHYGVLIALVAVGLAWLVFSKTLFGYQVRLVGDAPRAARFAGFSDRRLILAVMAISGGAAGLAGIAEVAGQIGQIKTSISPGYGFTAIIVAFLGRLSPVGILIAGLVMALTYIGGESAQIALKLPQDMTTAFQGILLMCVLAADVFTRYRVRIRAGRAA